MLEPHDATSRWGAPKIRFSGSWPLRRFSDEMVEMWRLGHT